MKKATKIVAAAGVVASVLAAGVGLVWADSVGFTIQADRGSDNEIMTPGHGLSLEIGGKHAVGYFETKDAACHLTIVLANTDGAEGGDSPGTRIVVPVLPGRGLQVDAANGRSAEFFCGPGAERMNARVFDRAPYKS
jgi:hypothetical protein